VWHDPRSPTLERGLDRSSPLALVMALMRSAVHADPARALCTTSLSLLVSRDENEMTIAEANGITRSSGRCDDNSIATSGTIPAQLSRPLSGRQRPDIR